MRSPTESKLINSLIEALDYIDKKEPEMAKSPLTFYSEAKALLVSIVVGDLSKGSEDVIPEIIVTPRIMDSGKFHACVKDKPGVWGCGSTEEQAIQDLKEAHSGVFK